MNSSLEECPQCFGAKELMTPKPKPERGFTYKTCSLCKGTGKVSNQIADDFVFAMNEDNFEEDNE